MGQGTWMSQVDIDCWLRDHKVLSNVQFWVSDQCAQGWNCGHRGHKVISPLCTGFKLYTKYTQSTDICIHPIHHSTEGSKYTLSTPAAVSQDCFWDNGEISQDIASTTNSSKLCFVFKLNCRLWSPPFFLFCDKFHRILLTSNSGN